MARLYANENFPLAAIERLRALGHDVLTSLEAGKANQAVPDADVLAYATQAGRALLTLNRRDFVALHRQRSPHAGIIVCTANRDHAALAGRIDSSLATNPTAGRLIRITKAGFTVE